MQAARFVGERINSGNCQPLALGIPGIEVRRFVSEECGAQGFSTGSAIFQPGARFPYHRHEVSECVTVLEGRLTILLEGRKYRLGLLDSIHIPAGVAHSSSNEDPKQRMVVHNAFSSARPSRTFTRENFPPPGRENAQPVAGVPETIRRFSQNDIYELSEGAFFCDLFAKRFGSRGICGGYGCFNPGSSLPCHIHGYDESITIIDGSAVCLVQGRRYDLSNLDTAFIPQGKPHRFLNQSGYKMAMIWVYAGDEPDRVEVDPGYCSGGLVWPGKNGASATRDGADAVGEVTSWASTKDGTRNATIHDSYPTK